MPTLFDDSQEKTGQDLTLGSGFGVWRRILGLVCMGLIFTGPVLAVDKYQDMINCDLHKGSCRQLLAGYGVTLTVTPRPVTAMVDLVFKVVFEKDPDLDLPPFIDLGMPGMNMGKNRVTLDPQGKGVYMGTGVIVRCKSGRRTWRATLISPGGGNTDFIFDVVY